MIFVVYCGYLTLVKLSDLDAKGSSLSKPIEPKRNPVREQGFLLDMVSSSTVERSQTYSSGTATLTKLSAFPSRIAV
jgi:hypothetical protein